MRKIIVRLVSVCLSGGLLPVVFPSLLAAQTAATPTFSPAAGVFTSAQPVTLGDTTPGAVIHYTLDFSTPSASSPVYSSAITISKNTTVKAIAIASGYANSAVASASYTIRAAQPTFSPAGGVYAAAQSVALSDTTPGATIYYTLDGTWPTSSSPVYTAPISVSKNTTIHVQAQAPGYGASTYTGASYTIRAAQPTFSPVAGVYTTGQSVSLSDTTSGATIRYTVDGTYPTTSSPVYSSAITVSKNTTINAVAFASGYGASTNTAGAYYIRCAAPGFSPAGGVYPTAQSVTLTDTTGGTTIRYTVDGTLPTTSSPVYSGPITISKDTVMHAAAFATGYASSLTSGATYTIRASTPTFTPAGGTYTGTQSVAISDTTAGATIYYTLDNTYPTTSSPVYTNPIAVSSNTIVRAVATASGYGPSLSTLATYNILKQAAAPTFFPPAGTYGKPRLVNISTTTPNAQIYYTLDNTNPTTSSTPYTGAISVSANTNLRAMAVAQGYQPSSVSLAHYTLGALGSSQSFLSINGTSASQTVPFGSMVTFSNEVIGNGGGGNPWPGQTNFCDLNLSNVCLGRSTAILGSAQLSTAYGNPATLKLKPSLGTHQMIGAYQGNATINGSNGGFWTLKVNNGISTTSLSSSGSAGNETLTASVTGSASRTAPTGTVSFIDTSNSNAVLGTATLGAGTAAQSFSSETTYQVGSAPASLTVGDFNNDGVPDIATANRGAGDGTVSILLGKGDGKFNPQDNFSIGCNAYAIAAGDFDSDGTLDLAVACYTDNKLAVLLGNGDGTFKSPAFFAVKDPYAIVVADLDGDGNHDIAVASTDPYASAAIVLIGRGDGTFLPSVNYPAGPASNTSDITVGRFTSSGYLDLVVAHNGDNFVSLLPGRGDGSFGAPVKYPVNFPSQVLGWDMNNDGIDDLVVLDYTDGKVRVYFGAYPGGGIGTGVDFPVGPNPMSFAVADFNGDGRPDVAAVSFSSLSIDVILGKSDNTFTAPVVYPTTAQAQSIVAGDFSGDGIADLAVGQSNLNNEGVGVLINQLTSTSKATLTGVTAPAGHQVKATYPGDGLYAPSSSGTIPLAIATPVF